MSVGDVAGPSLTSKYKDEQDPRHGGKLQWPGFFGLPVRDNQVRNIKKGEEYKTVIVSDYHCRVFDLNNDKDREYYKWVKERAVNGWFSIVHQDIKYSDDKDYPKVYLEWCQHYCQWMDLPEEARPPS